MLIVGWVRLGKGDTISLLCPKSLKFLFANMEIIVYN